MIQSLIENTPNYILYITIFIIFLLFIELGYFIGKQKRSINDEKTSETINRVTASILGLFVFLIAFVFSITAGRVDVRKNNVVLEANVIETAYLRADFLKDPYKSKIKDLLRVYVDLRLEMAENMTNKDTKYLAKSAEMHHELWKEGMLALKDANYATIILMTESLNELIDTHSKRMAASIYYRMTGNTWLMLFFVGMMGMLMVGIQNGLNSPKRYLGVIPLVLTFTVVFMLLEDLNNPQQGLFKIDQQPLIDVKNSIAK